MGVSDLPYLGVAVDMAGCPNNCRHCWLGPHRNGSMHIDEFKEIASQFINWRDEDGHGIAELGFFSWWREPDYRDDYCELWQLEQELSSPSRAKRFELLSTWRLARDENYAEWAATLEPKACQITFFGMEENTDWFMRRRGAFKDQLLATERCLATGISPRWQLFPTKRSLGDLEAFTRMICDLDLHKRCEAIGGKFEVFINGFSPEGSGYEIDDLRLEAEDLRHIPNALISICREGLDMLGHRTEAELLEELKLCEQPPNINTSYPTLYIDADYNTYPNNAEPAEWWRLGNLKTDGVDAIIQAYRGETPPGMRANHEIPLSALARRYGNPNSQKLYDKSDLICRFMHQWGAGYMEGIK